MEKRRDNKGRILRTGESQRPNGRYMYQYTDSTGKRRSLYSSRLNRKDSYPAGSDHSELSLREQEELVKLDRRDGLAACGGDLTVIELVKRYIRTRTGVRESTKTGYRTVVRILEKDPFGSCRIDTIRMSDAKLWLIKLQKQDGRGYSSIHNIRGVLRPAFEMALGDDLLRRNPFEFHIADVLYNDSQKREAISPKVENEFLRFISADSHFSRYYEAIYILLNTGMRISEFCGLTPRDVDFKNHCINVTGQLVRHSNMITEFEPPKTDAGYRRIPMSPDVEDSFRRLWDKREKVLAEPIIDGHAGFYCLDKNGRPMVAMHWEHIFKHIVQKYNDIYKTPLPNITPHVCRHTFCSKLARKGMNPKNLQYIMGHSDIGVTMNTYTHLEFDDAQSDFNRISGKKAVQ